MAAPGNEIATKARQRQTSHFISEANMPLGAKLYEVVGRHGTVYAVHDLDSNMFWSERTEQAARDLAKEKNLAIVSQRTISRDDLLRMMGQPPSLNAKEELSSTQKQAAKAEAEAAPRLTIGKAPKLSFRPIDMDSPASPLAGLAPPDDDVLVVQKPKLSDELIVAVRRELPASAQNVFNHSAKPVTPPADSDLLTGRKDVSHPGGQR
jgi:hypothetical protein